MGGSISPTKSLPVNGFFYPLVSTLRRSLGTTGVLLLWLLGLGVLPACSQNLPEEAWVSRVIDGDTIQLSDGHRVRYLGIDAPEVRRRVGDEWVVDPEPFAEEATAFNRQRVEGKSVRLEYDVRSYDRFGRLLAYVYAGGTMINRELLKAGLSRPMTIAPNARYAEEFKALAEEAEHEHRGLWSRAAAR